MDRNSFGLFGTDTVSVALRKESVDRNMGVGFSMAILGQSLSARRAWIEI